MVKRPCGLVTAFAVTVFGLAIAGAPAMAANVMPFTDKAEYSATRHIESEDFKMDSKVYHTPKMERVEMDMEGQKTIQIIRRDKKIAWTLMPNEKMYMESDLSEAMKQAQKNDPSSDMKMETTEVGKETIDGHPCTKYKVIATRKDGNKMGGFMWVTAEGIQIKQDLISVEEGKKARIKITLTNLKVGKQKDSLFEVPDGYQPMPSFGGMMKGLFGK